MYAVIIRRKIDHNSHQETARRAQAEFWPALQSSPGLLAFYVVNDAEQGVNTAISMWEGKVQADAFEEAMGAKWSRMADEAGSALVSDNRGEAIVALEPRRQGACS